MIAMTRRRYGGKVLPYDAEVEYLSFDGNQYIDTLVTPNETIEAELDVSISNKQGSTGLLSAREFTNLQTAPLTALSLDIWTNGSKIALNDYNYDSGWMGTITLNTRFITSIRERSLYFNSTLVVQSSTTSSFSHSVTYGLLRGHRLNDTWDTRKGVSGNLYACKIWKNDAVARDFIPVRKDGIGYMYDKVSRRLFGNSGTGAFVVGPDVISGGVVTNCKPTIYAALAERRAA